MRKYVIDAMGMSEKQLTRSIKEHAIDYDKLIIKNPQSSHNIAAGVTEEVEMINFYFFKRRILWWLTLMS